MCVSFYTIFREPRDCCWAGEQQVGPRDAVGEDNGAPERMQQPEGEVAEPRTPTRNEECPTPRESRARAGGVRSNQDRLSYESLYEETNSLLKNLHFERVKRLNSFPSAR
jgi:hypothetical protein